jgi:amino acid transporter
MSSISTNIRLGAGGAYAIVSQSLGLEVGGSLGIPRYISQGLAVTMYIFGFREGWLSIFPAHDPFLVDMIVFVSLFAIAYKSANMAIRTQYIIMAVIAASLVSIIMAAQGGSMQYETVDVVKWGNFEGSPENNFEGSGFWIVFAVFFPASTGIMAGANMSGELKDPRKSIMKGTLWAIAVSFVVYMFLSYWIARSASERELISNYNVMIDKAHWAPAVIAGILGATFSSALASIVGSSRILQAMGEHRVLPYGKWIEKRNKAGEPRNSMLITGALVFSALLIRDLNAIAPFVTLFFLITYAMINMVVIIEQNLGLVSFRPIFRVHVVVPWIGLATSIAAMFIIQPLLSLISLVIVLVVYGFLSKKQLNAPFEDARSGIFTSFAEWAAKRASGLPTQQERAWKPNLLVPIDELSNIKGIFSFIKNIALPKGSVKLMGIGKNKHKDKLYEGLPNIIESFREKGVFASWTVIETDHFSDGTKFGIQAMKGAFFKPNILFLNIDNHKNYKTQYIGIIDEAIRSKLGIILYVPHHKSRFGQRRLINVWVRSRAPDWKIKWDIGNLDLSILLAYKLKRNWQARIRLIMLVGSQEEEEYARIFMRRLIDLARLVETETLVSVGTFKEFISSAPDADLNIFGLLPEPDFDIFESIRESTSTTCLFVRDSGFENVMA